MSGRDDATMDNLPVDISTLIAGYLPPQDAINFSQTTCRKYEQLSLVATRPREIISLLSIGDPLGNDIRSALRRPASVLMQCDFEIPVISQASVHSMLISMSCNNEGWGNGKGRLFVVAEEKGRAYLPASAHRGDPSEEYDPCYDRSHKFGGRRVVSSSAIASHRCKRLAFTFKPKQNDVYHLWCCVAGGGAHILHLSYLKVQSLLYGGNAKSVGEVHDFLLRSNAFQSWDTIPLQSFSEEAAKTVFPRNIHSFDAAALPASRAYLMRRGLFGDEVTATLVEMIRQIWDDWERQSNAYDHSSDEDPEDEWEGNMDDDDFLIDVDHLQYEEGPAEQRIWPADSGRKRKNGCIGKIFKKLSLS